MDDKPQTPANPLFFDEYDDEVKNAPSDEECNSDADLNDENDGTPDHSTELHSPQTPIAQPPAFSASLNAIPTTPIATPSDTQSNVATGKSSKRKKRVPSKKIKAELDTDDEMLLDLHSKGMQDFEIAEYFAKERNLHYEAKSLVSRINRIIKCQVEHQDALLDEELTDWHADDDDFLQEAYKSSDLEIKQRIEELKASRWTLTSRHLMAMKPTSRFSATACEKRFVSLIDGTALPPPERDPNPAARQEAKTARILEKLARDEMKKQMVEAAKERTKRALEEKRRRREEKLQKAAETPARIAARVQRSVEKAAEQQAKREQKARSKMAQDEAARARDPRGALELEELHKICERRGLSTEGTKKEILLRIVQQDRAKNIKTLKEELAARHLTQAGGKDVIIERLAMNEAREFLDDTDLERVDADAEEFDTDADGDVDSEDETERRARRKSERKSRGQLKIEGEEGGSDNGSPRKKLKSSLFSQDQSFTPVNIVSYLNVNEEQKGENGEV